VDKRLKQTVELVRHQLKRYQMGQQTATECLYDIDTLMEDVDGKDQLGEYDPTDDMYSMEYTGNLR